PAEIRHEVPDDRERFERLDLDRLPFREVPEARHAGELRLAVDLHAARATLAGLAVPTAGEIARVLLLDPVDQIADHHARVDLDRALLEPAAGAVSTPGPQRARARHHPSPPLRWSPSRSSPAREARPPGGSSRPPSPHPGLYGQPRCIGPIPHV